jgi:hypothetical protein
VTDSETIQSKNAPQTAQDTSSTQLYKYGFWVAIIAIAAIVAAFLISLVRLTVSGDVATVASAMFAAIGTLAGAYFGFHAGSAGKQEADRERDTAEGARHTESLKSQQLAALARENHPDQVDKILGML